MDSEIKEILNIWTSGGWVMLPLALLACMIYSNAFTLLFNVMRTNLSGKDEMQWRSWVADPHLASGRVGHILRHTQLNVKSAKQIRNRYNEVHAAMLRMLDRRIHFLNILVATAPLLGLLGTVIGMLGTFFGLATSGGTETIGVISSGISEALITTQTGLTIALPALFMVMLIQRKKHTLEAKLARLESLTLTYFNFDTES